MKALRPSIAAAVLAVSISAAHAGLIYEWTGDCTSGCTGQAHATLTFENTYDGGPFVEHFISRDLLLGLYTPLSGIRILDNEHENIYGVYQNHLVGLHAELDSTTGDISAGLLDLCVHNCFDNRFQTFADGTWSARFESGPLFNFWTISGVNSAFSPQVGRIPEPHSLALVLLALAVGHALAGRGSARSSAAGYDCAAQKAAQAIPGLSASARGAQPV